MTQEAKIMGSPEAAHLRKQAKGSRQKNKKPNLRRLGFLNDFGVADGARTHDNRNHNPGLYQLSYSHR